MTKEELAAKLDGREYCKEITEAEISAAKKNSLVVVFGGSDDLCELRGAIEDELGVGNETEFSITRGGKISDSNMNSEDIEVLNHYGVLDAAMHLRAKAATITTFWCRTKEYSWTYETKIPHAEFDIWEDESKYCRGLVIDLKDLAE